jgi:rubrerythrin
MYKRMAREARAEGFTDIAALFDGVGAIEKHHEERFLKLLENVKTQKAFARREKQIWICRNCGHVHDGPSAPKLCPVCKHPQSYFEIKSINY